MHSLPASTGSLPGLYRYRRTSHFTYIHLSPLSLMRMRRPLDTEMYFLALLLQIAWIRRVWSQASLPTCAVCSPLAFSTSRGLANRDQESCLETSTPAQGKCSNVDIVCLCNNVGYVDVLACCLSRNCNAADQQGKSCSKMTSQ